jgi:hypothetical protein
LAAAKSITVAAGAAGFAATGAGAAFATGAAGTSATLAAGGGVCVVAAGVTLQQHLHNQRLSNQPSKAPARNHHIQHPKELNIFTPQ